MTFLSHQSDLASTIINSFQQLTRASHANVFDHTGEGSFAASNARINRLAPGILPIAIPPSGHSSSRLYPPVQPRTCNIRGTGYARTRGQTRKVERDIVFAVRHWAAAPGISGYSCRASAIAHGWSPLVHQPAYSPAAENYLMFGKSEGFFFRRRKCMDWFYFLGSWMQVFFRALW